MIGPTHDPSPELSTLEQDLHTRLVPSETQLLIAHGMLTNHPSLRSVIVPIALPGKQMGIWEIGQQVEHPNGFWFVHDNGPEHRFARNAAEATAAIHLGNRPGVAGWCVIHQPQPRQGGTTPRWTVFEGQQFPDPEQP